MAPEREPAPSSRDPLASDRGTPGRTAGKYAVLIAVAGLLHLAVVAGGVRLADRLETAVSSDENERVEVDVVRNQVEETDSSEPPPPEPTPPAPSPPEPDKPSPSAPKPDPDERPDQPAADPPDEPEQADQPPTERQTPGSGRDTPSEEKPTSQEAESAEPVDLEGLTMESTSTSSKGPAIKVGKGIDEGKMNEKFIDPDRVDEAKTGKGDGEGYGESKSPGTPGDGGCRDRKPRAVERVRVPKSKYPIRAKRRGLGGEVVAVLTVSAEGEVVDVEIVESAGHGFDELAAEAFRKWTFKPARRNCRAVRDTVRVSHAFSVER